MADPPRESVKRLGVDDKSGKAQTCARYDALASRYIRHYVKPGSLFALEKQRRARILEEYLVAVRPSKILDLGCGPGYVASRCDRILCDADVTGIDLSSSMIDQARTATGSELRFIRGDVEFLPFPSRSFDLVYALGVLGDLEALSPVLSESHRVLRSGGVFLFTYPLSFSISKLIWRLVRVAVGRASVSSHIGSKSLIALLRKAEFRISKRYYITYGNGLVNLPWTEVLNRRMEALLKSNRLGGLLAMTAVWIVEKEER